MTCPGRRHVLETFTAPGSFGDGEVLMSRFHPAGERLPLVVVFHGVHGCADPSPGEKYGDLGRFLAEEGIGCVLAESSRKRRDRGIFGDDRAGWAVAAFEGKTFLQELADAASALDRVSALWPASPLWIWGFSLGGLLGTLLAGRAAGPLLGRKEFSVPHLRGLVLAGSGDSLKQGREDQTRLPVLDSLPEQRWLHEAARNLSGIRLGAFRGTKDETFTQGACRRLVDLAPLPEPDRFYQELEGVDHAFRTLNGEPSRQPLRAMIRRLLPWWT